MHFLIVALSALLILTTPALAKKPQHFANGPTSGIRTRTGLSFYESMQVPRIRMHRELSPFPAILRDAAVRP